MRVNETTGCRPAASVSCGAPAAANEAYFNKDVPRLPLAVLLHERRPMRAPAALGWCGCAWSADRLRLMRRELARRHLRVAA